MKSGGEENLASFEPGSVLVVEDEPGLRACVARALAKEGFRVTTATTGEEGLRMLDGSAFDVILTDSRLPGLRGKGLVTALVRAAPASAVIVMSSDAIESEPIAGTFEEAAVYLVKPLRRETLVRAVAKAILQRRGCYAQPPARPAPDSDRRDRHGLSGRPI